MMIRKRLSIAILSVAMVLIFSACSNPIENLLVNTIAEVLGISKENNGTDNQKELLDSGEPENETVSGNSEVSTRSDNKVINNTSGFTHPEIESVETSSYDGENNMGMQVVDGNENSYWLSGDGDTKNPWIKIKFSKPFTISDISFVNGIGGESGSSFLDYGRVGAFELIYDDGEKDIFDIRSSDDKYWSEMIIPHTTSSVELRITYVYPGNVYNQVALSEVEFFYNKDSYFVQMQMGDAAPVSDNQKDNQNITDETKTEDKSEDVSDYIPDWFNWKTTGYGAQDIDTYYLSAGKWLSKDNKTVLYIDYTSSPDVMDYEIYQNGKSLVSYADLIWEDSAGEEAAYSAKDSRNDVEFQITFMGELNVYIENQKITLYLQRKKYDIY